MGRGLVHGATILALTGFLGTFFCGLAPMWFTIRIEEGEMECWQGEGIFTSRYWWGSTLYGPPCQDPLHLGPLSTHEAYCLDQSPPVNKYESSTYNADMCVATGRAKVTAVFAIVLSFVSVAAGLSTGFVTSIRERFEYQLAVVGGASLVSSLVFTMTTMVIMFTSPLFSKQHITALSHDQVGPDYVGFSCSFQTPLHSVFKILAPGAEKCVLVGPAVLVVIIGSISTTLGSVLFFKLAESAARHGSQYVSAYDPRANADTLFAARHYSLYGAGARRFSHLPRPLRFFLITIIPYFFVLSNALTWAAFLIYGIQVISTVDIGVFELSAARLHQNAMLLSNDTHIPTFIVQHLESLLVHATVLAGTPNSAPFLPRNTYLYHDTLNIFNFSPMTSISFFWASHSKLIAVASFVSIFVIPITKVIVWVWYYYAFADEVWRGRVLTWVDFSGKYILANLFILEFMGVALTFNRQIVIPWWLFGPGFIVPHNFGLVIEIRAGLGSGLGSWMYVATTVFSLFIGQTMVMGHNLATAWEEDRRSKRATSIPSTSASSPDGSDFVNTPVPPVPPPLTRLPVEPSNQPLLPTNRRSVLGALASFGSTLNLSALGQQTSSRGSSAANLNPLLRRLGPSFGTRYFSVPSVPENASTGDFVGMGRPMEALPPPLHPPVEALCDRVLSPMQGMRLRVTPMGKVVVWLLLFIYVGFLLVCQSWELFELHQTGFVGDVLVSPRDQYQEYSLVGLVAKLNVISYGSSPELSGLFFFFTALMPTMVAFAMVLLWTIDMTQWQQVVFFHWIEVATAWSSLDIFFICCIIMEIELENASRSLVSDSVPKLRDLEHIFLPKEKGILTAEMRLLPGFWILASTVLWEKIAIHFLMEHAVCAISERQAEAVLRGFAASMPQVSDQEAEDGRFEEEDEHLVANAAEGLLEADAGAVFSSAARYMSSYFPRLIYAGLPRSWWGTYGVSLGLLADAELVKSYYETGSWKKAAARNTTNSNNDTNGGMHEDRERIPLTRLISLESSASVTRQTSLSSLGGGAVVGEDGEAGPISF